MAAASNTIRQLETRPTEGRDGHGWIIFCALDVGDASSADAFVKEVLHKVLMQRMKSSPDTRFLCVTIVGNLTADDFARLWRESLSDPRSMGSAMSVFLAQMTAAEVIHGTPRGEMLGRACLLPTA
jgi:hypothetical protein